MILESLLQLRASVWPGRHPSEGGWFGGGETAAGIDVTETTALESTPIWQGMVLIASSIGSLPLMTNRRVKNGHERAHDHPLFPLLRYQPNPESTAIVFRQAQYMNRLGWGNSYAEIVRSPAGTPEAIYHLPSWLVKPWRVYQRAGGGLTTDVVAATPEDRARGGEVFYQVSDGRGGNPVWLPALNVFHVPYVSINGLVGLSPITTHRESIALGLSMQKSAGAIFGNAARPDIVLERPNEAPELTPDGEKALVAAFEASHRGVYKRGRVAVLQEGTKANAFSANLNELQFIESLRHHVPECARILNLSSYFLGHDGTKSTYSNVEGEWIRLMRQTLVPLCEADHQEIHRKLIGNHEAQTIFAEYETKAFLEGDTKTRSEYIEKMVNLGLMSKEEGARLENMPPIPEGQGGYAPAAKGPSAPPKADLPPPPDDDEDEEDERSAALRGRLQGMLEAALQRVVNREVREIRAAVKKSEGSLATFSGLVEEFYGRELPEFVELVTGPALGLEAAAYSRRYAAAHRVELRKQLEDGITRPDDQRARDVVSLLDNWTAATAREESAREIQRIAA